MRKAVVLLIAALTSLVQGAELSWVARLPSGPLAVDPTSGAVYTAANTGDALRNLLETRVSRLNATGTAVQWAVTIPQAAPVHIALDSAGDVYVLTRGADSTTVTKLRGADGASVWRAVGTLDTLDMAVSSRGDVYLTGNSGEDVLLRCLEAADGHQLWTRTFGGSGVDTGTGIALARTGEIVVTGSTASTDFPTTPGAYQRKLGGTEDVALGPDVYVARFSGDGATLVSSTLIGGRMTERPGRVAVDPAGNAYVTGNFRDSFLPVTPLENAPFGSRNFLAKFTPAAALTWVVATGDTLSGRPAVDSAGNAWLAGDNFRLELRVADTAVQATAYAHDMETNALIVQVDASGRRLNWSTYLGGSSLPPADGRTADYAFAIALDADGNPIVAGAATSADFPDTPGAFHEPGARPPGTFIAKIDLTRIRPVDLRAVTHAATLVGTPLVPGSAVSLFGGGLGPDAGIAATAQDGRLPTTLAGTRVLVDGQAAALLYVSGSQVNALLPSQLREFAEVSVCTPGGCSQTIRLRTTPQWTGIFAHTAFHADYTPVTQANPAHPGEIVQFWLTGTGPASPALPDGTITPATTLTGLALPLTALIVVTPAEIVYAGAAPGLPAGIGQVNIRVPASIPPGDYYGSIGRGQFFIYIR